MRLGDQLSLPLIALWQQKTRTLLTTLGVVFGSFVLAASLSIGQGVQDTISSITRRSDLLRTIAVTAQWRPAESKVKAIVVSGEMNDAKRKRIQRALADHEARFNRQNTVEPLTRKRLAELAAFDHVVEAVPMLQQSGSAVLDGKSESTSVAAVRPDDVACKRRLVAGRMFRTAEERAVVVSEFLLYQFGIVDDDDIAKVVGKTLRMEFRTQYSQPGLLVHMIKPGGGEVSREEREALDKLTKDLPSLIQQLDWPPAERALLQKAVGQESSDRLVYSVELPIVGVVRMPTDEDRRSLWEPLAVNSDCIVPFETAMNLAEEAFGAGNWDIGQVIVLVDDEEHTRAVYNTIKESGLQVFAPLDEVDRERLTYMLVFGGMTCVAAVAMLVSALGITNTMLMSVLERTREIGIMKAVGAAPGQLIIVFLIEGALIGLVGGVLGLLAAWCASYPGDAWVKSMVSGKFPFELEDPLFVFPGWIVASVLSFAVVVTTLAAVYPARRAARIDPVAALRHE
jgi:putative ABC transport system permease protein